MDRQILLPSVNFLIEDSQLRILKNRNLQMILKDNDSQGD